MPIELATEPAVNRFAKNAPSRIPGHTRYPSTSRAAGAIPVGGQIGGALGWTNASRSPRRATAKYTAARSAAATAVLSTWDQVFPLDGFLPLLIGVSHGHFSRADPYRSLDKSAPAALKYWSQNSRIERSFSAERPPDVAATGPTTPTSTSCYSGNCPADSSSAMTWPLRAAVRFFPVASRRLGR